MREMKFLILLVVLLAFNSVGARAGQITHTVTYDPAKLSITYDTIDCNVYAKVDYEGLSSFNKAGCPELPCDVFMLSVPYNATDLSINYDQVSYIDININATVFPSQEPRAISDTTVIEFTVPDSFIYNLTSFYPSTENIDVSYGFIFGSNKVASIGLRPVLYNPKNGVLRLFTSLTLRLNYNIDSQISPKIYRNEATIKEHEQGITASFVKNGADVANNSYTPTDRPNLNVGNNPETLPTYKYCIITNRALAPAFKKIIAMKRQKGISAGTVCIEDLMASTICNGGDVNIDEFGDTISVIADSAGVVRQYLKYAVSSSTSPTSFVLMGGTAPFSPVRYTHTYIVPSSNHKNHVSTDMYFSDLSLHWSHLATFYDTMNESEYIIPDILLEHNTLIYTPELFLGRLLCNNQNEIYNYSDKLFRYVFCPYENDYSYVTKSFFISSGAITANDVLEAANDAFDYVNHIINSETQNQWSGSYLVKHLNDYKYGYISLYAHGEPQSVAIYDKNNTIEILSALDSNPTINTYYNVIDECGNGLNNKYNKEYPNICYSISCVTAPYDKAPTFYCYTDMENKYNLAESFTLGKNYGGPAYLGNSRQGYLPISGRLEKEFIHSTFNRHYYSIGMAEAFSKVFYRVTNSLTYNHVILEHNLLGDPEFEMWTTEPLRYSGINISRVKNGYRIEGVSRRDTIAYCDNEGNQGIIVGNDMNPTYLQANPTSTIMVYSHSHIPYIAPMTLQECNINNSQFVYASTFSAANNVKIKNGAVYEIEATGNVHLGNGFIVENGATFAIKTPGKVTIDGCVFQSGANVKIEAGKVEVVKSFTAELGSKVEITKFVD